MPLLSIGADGDGEVEILAGDEVPAHGQVVGHGHAAQRARVRQIVGRNRTRRRDSEG